MSMKIEDIIESTENEDSTDIEVKLCEYETDKILNKGEIFVKSIVVHNFQCPNCNSGHSFRLKVKDIIRCNECNSSFIILEFDLNSIKFNKIKE